MKAFNTPKSDHMAEAARKVIPAATMSNFRRLIDYHPVYMTRGAGGRLYDIDGNEYIDFSLSYGPAVLGHSHEHVVKAIQEQAGRLYTPNVNDREVEAAQKVSRHVASAELVIFSTSGSEANEGALRAARAYTGRNKYIRFNGHYHGGFDHLMGGIVRDPDNPIPVQGEFDDDIFSQFTNTLGRYQDAFQEVYLIEWNDLPVLEKLLKKAGDDIAAVIMEPTMVNNAGCLPEAGYLQGVRDLCSRHGVVLIFDEVLTGFRIDLKGAQGYFGVVPDMTTLAKALGGGFPVSAITGQRQFMDPIVRADVVQGGTYNGNPLAMAAVIASIEEYEKDDGAIYASIRKMGTMLKEGLDQIAQEHEQPLLLQGFPGAWTFLFTPKKRVTNHAEARGSDFAKSGRFGDLLKQRGIMTSGRFCTSAAHTEKDIGDTLDRVNDVMRILKEEDADQSSKGRAKAVRRRKGATGS